MANGIWHLLERHLEDVDLEKNASVQDLIVAALLELKDKRAVDWKVWIVIITPLVIILLDKAL